MRGRMLGECLYGAILSLETHRLYVLSLCSPVQERGEKWDSALEMQLCYEIKTFLLAGHETSAAMLCWSLYELTQAPDCLKKVSQQAALAVRPDGWVTVPIIIPPSCPQLRQEAEQTFGKQEGEPTRDTVDGMVYSLCALKESLRKYSVVPVVTRNLAEDDELCGYSLPAGSWIICHLQASQLAGHCQVYFTRVRETERITSRHQGVLFLFCLQGVHHMYKDPTAWQPERFMPGGEYDQFDEDYRPFMVRGGS